MKPAVLKHRLKELANSLGIPLVGFTVIQKLPHTEFFLNWIESGYYGEMTYMARTREKRANPRIVAPWAKSVLVFGMPYGQNRRPESDGMYFARYSTLRDYHKTLFKKIKKVADFLSTYKQESRTKIYVDTGPVLEREFAMLAGLGWIGKNTNLISWKLGSYFLLGVLFTDIDLPPDEPVVGHFCGKCTRCIDACPTGALIRPWTLDARKCISYLTIENRGNIPENLREKIDKWVFGCDICQEVCPWNRNPISVLPEVNPPGLVDVVNSSDESFKNLTAGTVFKRPKRRGMIRNFCVALGNLGDPEKIELLKNILNKEDDPMVREHAEWAISKLSG